MNFYLVTGNGYYDRDETGNYDDSTRVKRKKKRRRRKKEREREREELSRRQVEENVLTSMRRLERVVTREGRERERERERERGFSRMV